MTASISTILSLINLATLDSSHGDFNNWGEVTNENLRILEKAIGDTTSKSVTSANVTLTTDEARSAIILLSGTLTGNRSVLTPNVKGFWIVSNGTSGSYTLTFKTTSGTGVTVNQGERALVYSDGTNMYEVANSGGSGGGGGGSGSGGAPNAVLRAGNSVNVSQTSWTKIGMTLEDRDTGSNISLSSGQFTVNAAGWVEWDTSFYVDLRTGVSNVTVVTTRLYNVTDGSAVTVGDEFSLNHSDLGADRRYSGVSRGGGAVAAGKTYRIEAYYQKGGSADDQAKFATTGGLGATIGRVRYWSS